MTNHTLDALRHVAGTHDQPWGAWLGAVLEEVKERGWVRHDGDMLYGALTEAGEAELARLEAGR